MTRLSQSTPTRVSARQRASFVTRRTSEGVIASYIHHNGRLGVLVEVNCETERGARAPELSALARDLAEHIAAAAPLAVRHEDLSTELVAKRRREFEEELRAHGKPESLLSGFVDVKMRAYLNSVVLLEQKSIREPAVSVAELIDHVSSSVGEAVQVRRFARFHMGIA
jgi:elongation factor Ts